MQNLDSLPTACCLRKLLKIKWQDRIPDTEVLKRAGMQSVHTLQKLAQFRWTGHVTIMPDERLPKKFSMENYKLENAPLVVRRSDTRTPSKPPLKASTYQQNRWNMLHRTEQSGEALLEEVLVNVKQKNQQSHEETCTAESQSWHHQHSFLPQTSLVPSATGSLELRLVSSDIL